MVNVWGIERLEEEDYKAIAKLVWEDDKNDVLDYIDECYKNAKVDRGITFEEVYKEYDTCIFQEYDRDNWDYWEKEYRKNYERE